MQSTLIQTLFGPTWRPARLRAGFALYALILILGSVPHARAEVGLFASGLVLHSTAYAIITFLLATGIDRPPLSRSMCPELFPVPDCSGFRLAGRLRRQFHHDLATVAGPDKTENCIEPISVGRVVVAGVICA
jgi:hypothetical protein